MTWHQWHHTAPISSKIGLSSFLARANASSPHSNQSMGWCDAERKYGLAESFRRFSGCVATEILSLQLLWVHPGALPPAATNLLGGKVRAALIFRKDGTPTFRCKPRNTRQAHPRRTIRHPERGDQLFPPAQAAALLHGVSRTQIPRIERLAPGKPFILPVIKTNAILAQLPAKVDFLIIDNRRKIQQPHVQILDHAARLEN